MRRFISAAALFLALFFSATTFSFAQTYGECTYSEYNYGDGCTPSSGGNNTVKRTTPVAVTDPTPVAATASASAAGGLTSAQKQSIFDLIASFGADATVLTNVSAALNSRTSTGTGSGSPSAFVRDLELGVEGEDVKALQQYLNTHGYTVAVSGAGSAGHETDYFGPATKAAIITLQKENGISPAIGYFGPLTRAHVASH